MNKDKQKNDKSKVQSKKKASNSKLKTKNSELRKRAEKKLRGHRVKQQAGSFKDAESVIHELQVHQIELEMQNEELRKSQIELEESRKKYSDLYDFAPVGYFTFDKNGLIIEVNLTGSGQLGAERNLLIKKPFSRFIHKDDQDIFFLHRNKVFKTTSLQSCEIRLKRKNGAEFYAQLHSSAVKDSESNITFCLTTVIDISRQSEIEQKLIASEKKFRDLVSNSLVGIFTTTLKGEIIYVNDAMLRMFEYKDLEEATSSSAMSLYKNPQDREAYIEALRKTGKVDSYELELLTRTGKTINLLASATLEGNILSGMLMEITDLKQMEDTLRKAKDELDIKVLERTANLLTANKTIRASNTLLRLLGTSVSRKEYLDDVVSLIQNWSGYRYVGIRVLNEDGTIPYETYSGFSREFWKSECWLSVKHDQCICTRVVTGKPEPQDSPAMTSFGSFCSGDTFQFLERLTEKDKKKFRAVCMKNGFASVSVTPVFYGGRIIAAIHMADKEKGKITREFVELLETLTPLIGEAIHKFDKDAERSHLLKAFEFTSDAIAIIDGEKIIRYVNPAFEQVTGYRSEEIIGNELSSVWGANGAEPYDEVWNILDKSSTWSGHLTGRRKDNTTYEEDTTISPVRDSFGAVINYIVTKRDVTERLKLESIAEAVNTMDNIGYVFAGIRHEIGNPVNSIKMTLNVLKKNLDKYGKENILEYLDRALSESSRIEYMLKSFKNFNMFEKPEMQDVEIGQFIYNFHALVLGDSMSKGITVTRAVSQDAKFFYVDPRALQQVLLNIFTNAMDACEGRKEPAIDISVSKIPDMIFIRITDNGRGMTAEQQKDLFKPFHTTKHHGTGLGLVICKKMLSKMNCFIEMQSIKDKGTTVDILIPEKKSE